MDFFLGGISASEARQWRSPKRKPPGVSIVGGTGGSLGVEGVRGNQKQKRKQKRKSFWFASPPNLWESSRAKRGFPRGILGEIAENFLINSYKNK